jgi:gluconolactonase
MEAHHAKATATGDLHALGNRAVSATWKLAAILVSDVVGYSRLAGADQDRILARLRTLTERPDRSDPRRASRAASSNFLASKIGSGLHGRFSDREEIMDRRAFLTASAVAATAAAVKTAVAGETEGTCGKTGGSVPVPDAHVESLDERFKGMVGEGTVERLANGFSWAEGPAYFAAGRYLIFSDIPNSRMMRLLDDDMHLSEFRQPSLNANGNTVDRRGRLYTCEQAARRVTRTEYDGAITVIADRYNGKKLNSPNDIVVASNGSVWFTDPTYGMEYAGVPEQEKHNVFRVDGKAGDITVVVDDFVQPNGILLSPDEKKLYIIDTPISHIRVFDVDIDTGVVSNGKVFADGFIGDGMRCDIGGNVWCSVGYGAPKENGVRCYAPDGALLGKIHLPESITNLTFGGASRNRLYICGTGSVYACNTNTRGVAPG